MITRQIIKDLVELKSGVEDISIKSRKLHEYRCIYFSLCKIFITSSGGSYEKIAQLVNQKHCSVNYGLKSLDIIIKKDGNTFIANIYVECYDYLDQIRKSNKVDFLEIDSPDIVTTLIELKQFYSCKLLSIKEKENKAISKLEKKIEILTKNDFIKKVLALEAQEIEELEQRFDVFFRVKAKLNEKSHKNIS